MHTHLPRVLVLLPLPFLVSCCAGQSSRIAETHMVPLDSRAIVWNERATIYQVLTSLSLVARGMSRGTLHVVDLQSLFPILPFRITPVAKIHIINETALSYTKSSSHLSVRISTSCRPRRTGTYQWATDTDMIFLQVILIYPCHVAQLFSQGLVPSYRYMGD